MQDTGKVDRMDLLPIQSFTYGPMEYEMEKANVSIGPLICKGLKNPDQTLAHTTSIDYEVDDKIKTAKEFVERKIEVS